MTDSDQFISNFASDINLNESDIIAFKYFHNAPIAIAVSQKGNLLYCNKAYLNLFEYTSAAELKNISLLDLIDPKERDKIQNYNKKREEGNNVVISYETKGLKKSGASFPFIANVERISLNGENATLVFITDITKIKIQEERIRKDQEAYRSIADLMHVPVIIGDVFAKKIVYANQQFKDLFRLKESDLSKLYTPEVYVNPSDRDYILKELSEKGYIHDLEIQMRRNDGSTFWSIQSWQSINYNNRTCVMVTGYDITERKKSEQLMQSFNEELRKSEQALIELNEHKTKFFSIISHDLRNPFTSILGISELIYSEIEHLGKNEIKEFIELIKNSAKGVFNLLENLLMWSRLNGGRIEFQPSGFNLHETVKEIINIYSAFIYDKKLELINEVKEDSYYFGDVNMVDTIIRNLLQNAIKFSKRNGQIKIYDIIDQSFGTIVVEDHGIGINNEDINKLFKLNSQQIKHDDSIEKGTGLGLILCKDFVEIHNGKIWVESEENISTKFKFTLPLYSS